MLLSFEGSFEIDLKLIERKLTESVAQTSKGPPIKNDVNATQKHNNDVNIAIKKKHHIVPSLRKDIFDIFHQIERRFSPLRHMFNLKKHVIQCKCCSLTMKSNKDELKSHLLSPLHLKITNRNRSMGTWTYYCDLCYKYEKTELKWFQHCMCLAHRQR